MGTIEHAKGLGTDALESDPLNGLTLDHFTQSQLIEKALKLVPQAQSADGAAGVVFGRNAIQVSDPMAFQAALCDVVKAGVDVEKAIADHKLSAPVRKPGKRDA